MSVPIARIAAAAWIAILAVTGGFQFYRDAPVDATVFCALAVALLADQLGALRRLRLRALVAHRALLIVSVAVAAGVLAFTPRHGVANAIVFALGGLIVLAIAWPDRAGDGAAPAPTRPSRGFARTALLWTAVLVAICLWELVMFFLGLVNGRAEFPALSDLLDPLVDNPIGRILFVAGWLLGGVALLRRGVTR